MSEPTKSEAFEEGYDRGFRDAPFYKDKAPTAVSIPNKYLGGSYGPELPKAWDGWTTAAHEYAHGYHAGVKAGQEK